MLKIIEVSADKTYTIRKEVLRNNIDLPFKFDGDLNETTFHLGAFNNDKIVGVASFMKNEHKLFKGSQFQLRGMATLPEVRGLGFGKELINKSVEILKAKNTTILWCNARIVALPFYEKLGFKIVGEPFDIEIIGTHYVLVKEF